VHSSYLVVLFYCHFIWFYLTCLNEINGDGEVKRLTPDDEQKFDDQPVRAFIAQYQH